MLPTAIRLSRRCFKLQNRGWPCQLQCRQDSIVGDSSTHSPGRIMVYAVSEMSVVLNALQTPHTVYLVQSLGTSTRDRHELTPFSG